MEAGADVTGPFWAAFLLAVATSMDNFVIGLTYGARGKLFSHFQNLVIAAVNAAGTMLSMGAGEITRVLIPEYVAKYLAGFLFICIGLDTLRQIPTRSLGLARDSSKQFEEIEIAMPTIASPRPSGLEVLSMREDSKNKQRTYSETLSIAVGLTFSNLAGGVGAGLADLDIILVTVLALLANFALLDIGERIGMSIRGTLPTTPIIIVSGGVLVIMGLIQILFP